MKKTVERLIAKTKKSTLAKNYLWVLLGQNIGTVFSMLTMIVTLKIISTDDYGVLAVIQAYELLISGLFCFRTFNGVVKYVTDAEKDNDFCRAGKYFNSALLLDAVSGIVSFVMGIVLLTPITKLMSWNVGTVTLVNLYLPAVVFLPLMTGAPVGILRKMGRFKQVNIIHAVVFGLQFLTVSAMWIFGIKSFNAIVIAYAAAESVEALSVLVYAFAVMQKSDEYRNVWRNGFSFDFSFVKYNVCYGLLSTFDQLLGNVSTMLINRYIGNFATAYLKVITRICGVFTKLTNPVGQVLYPELCLCISEKEHKRAYKISAKYFAIVGSIGTALVCLMFSTYDIWIRIFDPSMSAAKIQSLLYMIYTVLAVSIIGINQLTLALDLVDKALVLTAIFDVLYIVCLIPAIRRFDVYGYLFLQIIQLLCVVSGKMIFIKSKLGKLKKDPSVSVG